LAPGETLPVSATADQAISFEWEVLGAKEEVRRLPTTSDTVLYTAPQEGGTAEVLTVRASNDHGTSSPASLIIKVLPPVETAAVRLDALAIPAGWMSGGTTPTTYITLTGGDDTICNTGADCFHITYQPGGTWAGIFWWPSTCGGEGTEEAWETARSGACGVDVLQAGGFSKVTQLTFLARGEKGGEVVEFRIGASDIAPIPGRATGKVSLTSEWQPYSINLEGIDLTNAVGLFLWTATDVDNPNGAVFYLEDVQFEGEQ
jgi:hypothetical protein